MNPNQPQFEKYWREKIANEVADAMVRMPEINAYGIWLLIKGEQ